MFLVTNLLTQLGVNVAVQALFPVAIDFYNLLVSGIFFYTPLEIAVLLVEMAAFALLLREHRRRRAVGYAAAANLCSWLLGARCWPFCPCKLAFRYVNPPHHTERPTWWICQVGRSPFFLQERDAPRAFLRGVFPLKQG